jgi:septal ring factor EnvC (AmiA/AmiB activator)
MPQNISTFIAVSLFSILTVGVLKAADQATSPEEKLRGMLRSTMLQLREAQNQLATLQTAKAESDKEKQTLSDRLDELTKQTAADKEVAAKTIADLNTKITDQNTQLTQYKDALEKWQQGYKQAEELAATKEAQRAKFASQVIVLQRRVEDDERKNAELYRLGKEILNRYEKFGLGTALTAREPFVGITRVKLENLVQDYSDKLTDQTVKPGQNPSPSSQNTPKPDKTASPSGQKSE